MRSVLFFRTSAGFNVREVVNGIVESDKAMTFEQAFRRMSELVAEGFREIPTSETRDYLFEKQS